jgi:prepilin-type N-terminal cleavage/methylation domain-containing protein
MKKAFSLIEMLVVIVVIAMLVAIAIPGIKAMQKSFDSTGAEGMISAALATAKTLAIKNDQYAGVRFQKAGDPNNALKADQYMIFITYLEYRKAGNLTDAFCAVEGYKPIKLPENTGVMDMTGINADSDINDDAELVNATSFSIVFSPAGKLVIHNVRVRNKDGKDYNDSPPSNDAVFNIESVVSDGNAMFLQDDYPTVGLYKEQSRKQFVIYDCGELKKLDRDRRYSDYLKELKEKHLVYVNPYTGELIR